MEFAVRVLAETDAIHLPIRKRGWGTYAPANRFAALQQFAAGGVPARSSGVTPRATAAVRQAFADLLKKAEVAGLVTTTRTRGRHPLAKLTDKGDELTRAVCGLPGVTITCMFLADLKGRTRRGSAWVSEFRLAKPKAAVGDLVVVQNEALPALWRGWAEARSDIEGHARYRLTPAGEAALKGSPKEAFSDKGGDPFQEEAASIYWRTWEATRSALMNDSPENLSELGEIPLSIGED